MEQKMTWEEMKTQYPDEWLLVTDFEINQYGEIKTGIVYKHSKDKQEVYRSPQLGKPVAFEYTGESTFSGFRSHAEHHSV